MLITQDWNFDQPSFWVEAFNMTDAQAAFAASLAVVPVPLLPEAIREQVRAASLTLTGLFTDVPQLIADYVRENTFDGRAA